MKNIFTEHPHSIGETYFQHFYHASRFGLGMIIGGTACCLHAFFPFLFKKTGSNYLIRMTSEFVYRMPVMEERIVVLAKSINNKMNHGRVVTKQRQAEEEVV